MYLTKKALYWMMVPTVNSAAILEEAACILDVCPTWLRDGTGDPTRTVRRIPLYNLSNGHKPLNNVIALAPNENSADPD